MLYDTAEELVGIVPKINGQDVFECHVCLDRFNMQSRDRTNIKSSILAIRQHAASQGSPKDRGRIEGWDQCPLGYTYPDENETIAIIDGALESLITDLKKPLKRKGTGGKPFTIWREDLKVTARNPLVLTRVAKRKARASSFLDSFPGWMDNYDALPHPREPCINWSDIPSLSASLDEDGSSTEDEDELQDAQSHVPLNAAARNSLGDGPAPEMVSALGPNGLGTTESAGDPGEPPECQDTNNQRFDALLRCLPGRDQRFVHKGELEPDKQDNDDGYISDDDCVAVLFDMTSGPAKKQRKYQVFYGNVAKLTRDRSGRQVPGPRVHINDGGKAACKWFDEKLDKHSKPVNT
ncbi:TPA: hypothetical protein ACH3X1_007392 [Trebouxia sp. C0004]